MTKSTNDTCDILVQTTEVKDLLLFKEIEIYKRLLQYNTAYIIYKKLIERLYQRKF